jgi:hypothetical protein
MRRALFRLALSAAITSASFAAEPERKAVPIGEWNLSGRMVEKTQMDGPRVVRMMAKGDAKLRKGRNPLLGPWTLEASAEIIEADFKGKKFIVHGPYRIFTKSLGPSGAEISGPGPDSSAEILFANGVIDAKGPNRVNLVDPVPPKGNGGGEPAKPKGEPSPGK